MQFTFKATLEAMGKRVIILIAKYGLLNAV